MPGCAESLCEHGANVAAVDDQGYAAIHFAVKVGSLEIVKLLGDKYKAPLNLAANDGYTPLLMAVVSQPNYFSDIVETLLREGADANLTTTAARRTPLHAMLMQCPTIADGAHAGYSADQFRVAELLLTAKADINAVTSENETPLDVALKMGDKKMAQTLKNRGAKPWQELEKNRRVGVKMTTATRAMYRFQKAGESAVHEPPPPSPPPPSPPPPSPPPSPSPLKPIKKRGITDQDYERSVKENKALRIFSS